MSPLRDLKLCLDLYRVFRSEKFDIVHTITIKPNTYGTLAAWLAGVPRIVALVCGRGYGFAARRGLKWHAVRLIVLILYWLAGRVVTRIWFQNPDDLERFVKSGLITRNRGVLIRGSGVNVQEFSPNGATPEAMARLRAELGVDGSTQVALMAVLRVVSAKGVQEFVEASELAAAWDRPAKFVLVGPAGPRGALAASGEPDAVSDAYLQAKASPHFMHLGFRADLKELMSVADIVVLPSYYGEGVPRVLLEGMAMGKPIVTTDHVGCRETVDEGRNGFLAPVRDSRALAAAIEKLVRNPELRASFGRHSRAKAEAEFSNSVVLKRVMTELYGLDG